MKVFRLDNMKGGWFVGNFNPTALSSDEVEVCFKKHPKGDMWDTHFHKVAVEVNLLVRGKMRFQNVILVEGDIFVVYPWEISNPEFLEDCEVIIVKIPSVSDDKYSIKM